MLKSGEKQTDSKEITLVGGHSANVTNGTYKAER